MNSTTVSARVQARGRHDSRLQSMTLGAAALGVAATGVFGYAAALTYSGTSTANAADQNLGDQNGTQPYTSSANGGTTTNPNVGVNPNGGGTTITPNAGNQQPVNPPTTTRHRQHAVSGGS